MTISHTFGSKGKDKQTSWERRKQLRQLALKKPGTAVNSRSSLVSFTCTCKETHTMYIYDVNAVSMCGDVWSSGPCCPLVTRESCLSFLVDRSASLMWHSITSKGEEVSFRCKIPFCMDFATVNFLCTRAGERKQTASPPFHLPMSFLWNGIHQS